MYMRCNVGTQLLLDSNGQPVTELVDTLDTSGHIIERQADVSVTTNNV